jgi:hypothetical protein
MPLKHKTETILNNLIVQQRENNECAESALKKIKTTVNIYKLIIVFLILTILFMCLGFSIYTEVLVRLLDYTEQIKQVLSGQ